jgi:hypothetical protein
MRRLLGSGIGTLPFRESNFARRLFHHIRDKSK